MPTHFFTNDGENTLLNKFAAVFENNPQIAEFDVLVGYFNATGYFQLRPHLDSIKQIRILVGIDVDKLTQKWHREGLSRSADDSQSVKDDYCAGFLREIQEADYSQELEQSILQFVKDIVSLKIQIKAHPNRKLHAKVYIFRPDNFNQHSPCEVIAGSSNLTSSGIGANPDKTNYEFNALLRDFDDVSFATEEFEKLWNESVDILPSEIQDAKDKTFLRDDFTPYELYMKLLIEYFGREIEFNPDNIQDLPEGVMRLAYQADAVNQGFELLKKHNGFFLSDVVGLGKTIVAILIARQVYHENHLSNTRTLIVSPTTLLRDWRDSVDRFNLGNVEYQSIDSLHKIDNPKRYDLIIVDESHRFRNDTSDRYKNLQIICKSPAQQGGRKKVILISATPLNNRPDDIRNQILLFQDANNSSLDDNLNTYFAQVNKQYDKLLRVPSESSPEGIDQLYADLRNKIIEPITVRRTRGDLVKHSSYKDDLTKHGINFPLINQPETMLYQLDAELNGLYDDTLNILTDRERGLKYARYRLISYLKPEFQESHSRYKSITDSLAALMRTLLIKRMDSSFVAFHRTLHKFVEAYMAVLQMEIDDRIIIAPSYNLTDAVLSDNEDELLARISSIRRAGRGIKIYRVGDFQPELMNDIRHDYDLLRELHAKWSRVVVSHDDPKFDKFMETLVAHMLDKKQNPEQKLVIFSESVDTTTYLSEQIKRAGHKVLAINARNRDKHRDEVKSNFDANLDLDKQRSDYDILITTETLAEGVNLHRANTIANYDTPWNSTRLMQRIGRINRIGTSAKEIHIFNFLPTEKIEGDIGLRHKASMKLQAFHSALGEDSQIYTKDEDVGSFGLFDQRIEADEGVSERLNFLMEVRKFRESSPSEFERILNLPLKIRNAREPTSPEMHERTLTFLRDRTRNAFYDVGPDTDIREISFMDAAKIYKCTPDTQSVPLPEHHHEQVRSALRQFDQKIQEKLVADKQHPDIPIQSIAAIRFIKTLRDLPGNTESEKNIFDQAIALVKQGSTQGLPRDINMLYRAAKSAPMDKDVARQSLIEIIQKYPIELIEDDKTLPAVQRNLEIIISQSFQIQDR